MKKQDYLSEKGHWDQLYQLASSKDTPEWKPVRYNDLSLEYTLLNEIDRYQPKTILEVGCGNSFWLPYLAKIRSLKVYGLEYSEVGCELAQKRLNAENIVGTIFCQDLFSAQSADIGQFDFVYSLGLVEHFSNLRDVIIQLMKFVKPGGVLFTEVPNLSSFHGILVRMYQPRLLEKHLIVDKNILHDSHTAVGLRRVRSSFVGLFSLGIVAWGTYQRCPKLDRIILPISRRISTRLDRILTRVGSFNGTRCFSPYIYAVGERPIDGMSGPKIE